MICPHCKGEFIVTVEEFVKHTRNCQVNIPSAVASVAESSTEGYDNQHTKEVK